MSAIKCAWCGTRAAPWRRGWVAVLVVLGEGQFRSRPSMTHWCSACAPEVIRFWRGHGLPRLQTEEDK